MSGIQPATLAASRGPDSDFDSHEYALSRGPRHTAKAEVASSGRDAGPIYRFGNHSSPMRSDPVEPCWFRTAPLPISRFRRSIATWTPVRQTLTESRLTLSNSTKINWRMPDRDSWRALALTSGASDGGIVIEMSNAVLESGDMTTAQTLRLSAKSERTTYR